MLDPLMAEVLRLTRAGRLLDATSLIQARLPGGFGTGNAAAPAHRADLPSPPPSLPSARPSAALSLRRRHSGATGSLDYRLHVPAGGGAGLPVVVMLHGCTQTPEDFALGTGMTLLAAELGFVAVYPEQARSANGQLCWNWFRPGDQQRDRGEPAAIAGIVRDVLSETSADASRVYVAGLSAGGAAAAIMAARYPDLFAAVGIHSGLACGAARDVQSAFAAMRGAGAGAVAASDAAFVPTIVFHGDRDQTVHEGNGRRIVAAAATAAAAAGMRLTTSVETGRTAAGTAYRRETSVDDAGRARIEHWIIAGAGHAWSGGAAAGSYTNPAGPDASREMMRFFLTHRLAGPS